MMKRITLIDWKPTRAILLNTNAVNKYFVEKKKLDKSKPEKAA